MTCSWRGAQLLWRVPSFLLCLKQSRWPFLIQLFPNVIWHLGLLVQIQPLLFLNKWGSDSEIPKGSTCTSNYNVNGRSALIALISGVFLSSCMPSVLFFLFCLYQCQFTFFRCTRYPSLLSGFKQHVEWEICLTLLHMTDKKKSTPDLCIIKSVP